MLELPTAIRWDSESPLIHSLRRKLTPAQPTTEVTEDEWERVFKVNVKSIYLAGKIVIPRLIEQGQGGSIVNISSTGAARPRPGLVWYNASKGAVTNVSLPPVYTR